MPKTRRKGDRRERHDDEYVRGPKRLNAEANMSDGRTARPRKTYTRTSILPQKSLTEYLNEAMLDFFLVHDPQTSTCFVTNGLGRWSFYIHGSVGAKPTTGIEGGGGGGGGSVQDLSDEGVARAKELPNPVRP